MFLVVTYRLTVFGKSEEEEEEEEEEKKEKRGSRASELCGAHLPNFITAFICYVCVFGTRQ
jgi:hypothetical protein